MIVLLIHINLKKKQVILHWHKECAVSCNTLAAQETTFLVINTRPFVSLVTLSTQGKGRLFEQLNFTLK